jgi:PAS domain S-box-containing protein
MTTKKAGIRKPGGQAETVRGRRRGAKKPRSAPPVMLVDRPGFERMLSELSAEFIRFPAEHLDGLIEDAQRRVCESLGLDMSTLWQSTEDDPGLFTMTHYCRLREGPPLPLPMTSGDFFPWTTKELLVGKIISVSSLDELPADAGPDREIRRYLGIKSFVVLPLSTGREPVFGCLSFNTIGEERVWADDTVQRLRLVAELIASALARKRADERLRQSEAKFRMLVERMNDGLVVLDERHRVSYVNRKVCEILGISADEMQGRSPTEFMDEKSSAVVLSQLEKRVMGASAPYEVEWRPKTGSSVITIVTPQPIFDQAGGYRGSFAVLTDITERKKIEALLRDDVEHLRSILEATSGGVWDWNIQSGAAVFSPKYSRMLGYTPEEFAKHYDEWGMIVHPDDIERVKQAHADHFEKGLRFSVEFRMKEKSGRWHWIHSRGILLERDAQGRPLRMVGTHQDIQERKNAEIEGEKLRGELAHINRRILLGELASSLAHELNQPLGAILNNAEAACALLEKPRPDQDEVREILSDIVRDDMRAGEVVRKIRGLVKRKDMNFEPLAVSPLILDVLDITRGNLALNGVSADLDAGPDLPPVLGDRVHLQQVLLNLITNAIEAMRDSTERKILVRAAETEPGTLTLSVSDTGAGFGEHPNALLFTPFFTTKPDGLGMGLSICASIVEAHGGKIRAENNPARGATFSFSLKALSKSAP